MTAREDNPIMQDLGFVRSERQEEPEVFTRQICRDVKSVDFKTLMLAESILFSKDAWPPAGGTILLKLKEMEDAGFPVNYDTIGRIGRIPYFLTLRREVPDALKKYRSDPQIEINFERSG